MPKWLARGGGDGRAASAAESGDLGPASDSELSTSRPRVPDLVPHAWLDRLLLATADLPLSSGEGAVFEAMVDCIASILTSHAVGVCFVHPDRAASDRVTLMRLPVSLAEKAVGVDPTRLFPEMKYEYVAVVAAGAATSTLHIASDHDELELDGSPAVHLVDRAATVLGRALPSARASRAAAEAAKRSARTLERRMLEADKLATFGQLAAGIVHELNNPLTSIVAYSGYLIRKSELASTAYEAEDLERLRRISESANRMLRFTRELVGYARPSGSAAGPVSLNQVVDQAVSFCEHLLSAANVHLERLYDQRPIMVRGVSEQLVQVFVNLITNACQAAPSMGGRIVVDASEPDAAAGSIVVVVEDNGCGIAPENMARIFVPFFTTKRETHGTGLGLSIIKNIVESHGGSIRVESQLGRGTRFTLDLPAFVDPPPPSG